MGPGAIKGCLYGVMFLNLGVLLYVFKRQHTLSKAVTTGVGVLLSVMAIGSAISIIKLDEWVATKVRRRITAQEIAYQKIGYKRLGEAISKRHPEAKVLIIKQRPYQMMESSATGTQPTVDVQLSSLKEGIGGNCTIVAVEEVVPDLEFMDFEGMSMRVDMEKVYTAKLFDALVKKHPSANVVVSLVGLPINMKEIALWKEKDPKIRPELVLANVSPRELRKAMRQGFISIILLSQFNGSAFDEPMPTDEDAAFNKRFLIMTPENLDELIEKYPKQF